jgi:uncharacterized protein YndB with AHSA1/START domain
MRQDTASRIVPAEPNVVWRAFSDADTLMSWLPPDGMTGRALTYEFREGGRYRIELRYGDSAPPGSGKTTDDSDVSTGRFLSIAPGQRIVYSVEFESADAAFAGEMRLTWTFDAVAGGTRVTIVADDVPSGISKEDHDAGLGASLENLARHVAASSG